MNSLTPPGPTDQQALAATRQRLIESGALGRSSVYLNLLDYLLSCSANGKQPKEFEIAVDVLKRDSSFDVARDSVVRVYIHQLRKRLDNYFNTVDPDASLKLSIPKGQYTSPRQPSQRSRCLINTSPEQLPAPSLQKGFAVCTDSSTACAEYRPVVIPEPEQRHIC